MTHQQRVIIADLVNNEMLRFYNQIDGGEANYSNMEMVMKHLYLS